MGFKLGDTVRIINNRLIGIVAEVDISGGWYRVTVKGKEGRGNRHFGKELELVMEQEESLEDKKIRLEKELDEVNKYIESQVPEYVKFKESYKYTDGVFKVIEWGSASYCILEDNNISNLQPFKHLVNKASKEEYDAYQESIPKFVVGKWYKHITSDYLVKYSNCNSNGFYNGNWGESNIVISIPSEWRLALQSEVASKLIPEAKRRGFIEGVTFKDPNTQYSTQIHSLPIYYYLYDDTLWNGSGMGRIYEDGVWAEIVISLPDIIINYSKAEFEGSYIKFGCQSIHMNTILKLYNSLIDYNSENDYDIYSIQLTTNSKYTIKLEEIKQIVNYYKSK